MILKCIESVSKYKFDIVQNTEKYNNLDCVINIHHDRFKHNELVVINSKPRKMADDENILAIQYLYQVPIVPTKLTD